MPFGGSTATGTALLAQAPAGIGGMDVQEPAVPCVAMTLHEPLALEPIQDPDHRAGTQMDMPGDPRGGQGSFLRNRDEGHQLRPGYPVLGGQFPRVHVDAPDDLPDRVEDPKIVPVLGQR